MADQDKFATALGHSEMDHDELDAAALSDLDALFSEAKHHEPAMSARLENAVLADALAAMPAPDHGRQRQGLGSGGMFRQLADAVGGWPSLSGMAMASLAGLWVGFLPPTALSSIESLARTGLTGEIHGEVARFESFDLASVLSEDLE